MSSSNLSLTSKLTFYSRKYGLFRAICSYLGRHSPLFWQLVGPLVTRNYITKWETSQQTRILNLGGGSNCIEGCLTVDIDPRADAYVDITQELPFADDSVDAIFCEEVIEHVNLQAGQYLLSECWRILKPEGWLRIATPDLNWFAHRVGHSIQTCHDINAIFYEHGHRYLYSREALYFYCQETGFINFRESFYQDSESKLGYLDSHADRFNHAPEISQYLEAQKPVSKSCPLP